MHQINVPATTEIEASAVETKQPAPAGIIDLPESMLDEVGGGGIYSGAF